MGFDKVLMNNEPILITRLDMNVTRSHLQLKFQEFQGFYDHWAPERMVEIAGLVFIDSLRRAMV